QLLRDGATLVTSVDDILEELRYARPNEPELDFGKSEGTVAASSLSEVEQAVMNCFQGGEIASPDTLSESLSKSAAEISSVLMGLELKRMIVKRADGCFEAK
ncbi:MAG TPA: DNA-protecting protein DprA, partial [Opitutae bacterium]|nr:DNA-protecting protein DprA [Opitutae bacterium]